MTFNKPIPEKLCPTCKNPIIARDIHYEPPESSTGFAGYAETLCCGDDYVLEGYPDLDELSEYKQVPLIKNGKVIDL